MGIDKIFKELSYSIQIKITTKVRKNNSLKHGILSFFISETSSTRQKSSNYSQPSVTDLWALRSKANANSLYQVPNFSSLHHIVI
jgi:hypothetical protein